MSWRYPTYYPKAGDVAAIDWINEAIAPWVQEISGKTNEHNWMVNLTGGTRLLQNAGAVMRVYDTSVSVNHGAFTASREPTYSPTDAYKVPRNTSWNTVSGLSYEFSARGGPIKVRAGLQINFGQLTTTTNYFNLLAGAQFGIAIDGSVQGETIIGGAERDHDRKGDTISSDRDKQRLSGVFEIAPGLHTVSIMARMGRQINYAPLPDNLFVEVFNRSLVIKEGH